MPWKPGPRQDVSGRVFVGVTDFMARSEEEGRSIYEIGLELGNTWPVMQGAVGLWSVPPDTITDGSGSTSTTMFVW